MLKVSSCFDVFKQSTVCQAYQVFVKKNNVIEVREADERRSLLICFAYNLDTFYRKGWEYCNFGLLVYLDSGINFTRTTLLFYKFYSDIRQILSYEFCTMTDLLNSISKLSIICGHGRFF